MGYKYNPFTSNFDRVEAGSSSPDIETITGDSGGAVGPDGAFNINLLGNPDIDVVGNPGTNTLQLTNLTAWSKYVVDPTAGNSRFQTIQAALDQANSDGGGTVVLHPAIYTENLTLYANVDIWGACGVADTQVCKIIGVHTPPAAGSLTIRNIFLESATDIFNSAAAGTGTLILIDCAIDVTNGYTFNLPNWTGGFACFDIGEIGSTDDGWVNNTGGATVFMTNITMGAGNGNTMVTSGFVELYNCVVQCPVDFQTGTNGIVAGGTVFKQNVTFSNNSTLEIANSYFSTGASQALTYNSSANSSISDCTINSSNSPAIGGTGAGTLSVGNISFLSNSAIAGTVNTSFGVIQSGIAYLNNISFDEGSTTLSSNGQLWIGGAGSNPQPATLTQGNGITITNAAHFIRIDTTASVATQYTADSGSAVPVGHILNVLGGTGCSTTGAGDTLTIDLDAAVPLSFPTDSGTATPAANALTVAGGSNINTSGAGATVTVNLDTNISVGTIDCTQITIDPGASGDSFVQFDINSTGEFRIGVDDTDDSFRISQGSALGTNDTFIVTAAGEVTKPLQPAFQATTNPGIAQNSVTGAGTVYTVLYNSERFDVGGDYSSPTFTAPVTGKYLMECCLRVNGVTSSATVIRLNLITSNKGYQVIELDAGNLFVGGDNGITVNGSMYVDMDAADTASVQVQVDGMAGDTVNIAVAATANQSFAMTLVN